MDRCKENGGVKVEYTRRNRLCLSWYGHENQCWVPFQDVLCTITVPHFQGRSGQQYPIEKEGYGKIISSISKNIYQIKR